MCPAGNLGRQRLSRLLLLKELLGLADSRELQPSQLSEVLLRRCSHPTALQLLSGAYSQHFTADFNRKAPRWITSTTEGWSGAELGLENTREEHQGLCSRLGAHHCLAQFGGGWLINVYFWGYASNFS